MAKTAFEAAYEKVFTKPTGEKPCPRCGGVGWRVLAKGAVLCDVCRGKKRVAREVSG